MVKKKLEFETVCVLPQENKIDFKGFSFSKGFIVSFEGFVFFSKDFFDKHALVLCFGVSLAFVLFAFLYNVIYFVAFVPVFALSILLLIEKMTFLAIKKDFDNNGIF